MQLSALHFRLFVSSLLLLTAHPARGDIYEWEWIDPLDHAQGKQESTTLVPGGAGVNAAPGANLRGSDLTMAYLIEANLTAADFYQATLTNADFSGALVSGGSFYNTTTRGFTAAQLYSTASYQSGDLSRIRLVRNDLTGWNFAGKNLTDAQLWGATLTDADFTGAVVSEANFSDTTSRGFTSAQLYSTASYQSGDLSGIRLGGNDLTGCNFAGKNLTDAGFHQATLTDADFTVANLTEASFYRSSLTDADFTGAVVRRSDFGNTTSRGFKAAQLYSSASYQAGDLTGIGLGDNDLSGWNFAGKNLTDAGFSWATLTTADFTGANLINARLSSATLTSANFTGANLSGASLDNALLTRTDFSDSIIRGATFYVLRGGVPTSFTAQQLYSTASYQTGDLTEIGLGLADLTGWNFAGMDLTDADFRYAYLTDADFAGAVVSGVNFYDTTRLGFTAAQLYSTASYQMGDLAGIELGYNDLTGWNFAGKTLIDADMYHATLTHADFTAAVVSGANFSDTTSRGFTAAQLYSTASYQAGDLAGIALSRNNLTGWNFAAKNLTGAYFAFATLTNADFTGANLTNVELYQSTLTNADFTAADTRGASGLYLSSTNIVRNMISSDGRIVGGLHLEAAETMRLWDYDGETPIPILIEDGMSIDPSATLHAVFDADAWGSTIAFEAGVDVALDGTLLLEFAEEVHLAEQIGRTIDLFDWDGVSPTGEFIVESPFQWDLSSLYSSGEVTLLGLGGDFNGDGDIDGADFLQWQRHPNSGNLTHWQANYGGALSAPDAAAAVPEPATLLLLLAALASHVFAARVAPTPGRKRLV